MNARCLISPTLVYWKPSIQWSQLPLPLGVADRTKPVLHKENPDTRAILQNQLLEMQHDPTRKRKTKGKQNKTKKKPSKNNWNLGSSERFYLSSRRTNWPTWLFGAVFSIWSCLSRQAGGSCRAPCRELQPLFRSLWDNSAGLLPSGAARLPWERCTFQVDLPRDRSHRMSWCASRPQQRPREERQLPKLWVEHGTALHWVNNKNWSLDSGETGC